MESVWFAILSVMLATYVVLDGFDLGAGILHGLVARTDDERRTVIAAIGPVWDGNEVWLLASGGVLVFSFPRAYAAGFSGFYMPLMMVLWLLVLRGLSIEFRSKEANPLWRSFWDGTFIFSSTLLAVLLGAALGNVIRGVPLDASGFFSGPLFTDLRMGPHPGVLDWYTVLLGLLTLCILAGHGALYLNWKTAGPVQERSRAVAGRAWTMASVLWVLASVATARVRPELFGSLAHRLWAWPLVLLVLVSFGGIVAGLRGGWERYTFLASCAFIVSLLAATAAGVYPTMLISTLDPAYSLTALNASNSPATLRIGLFIWMPAIALAIGYFTYLFRSFAGKVSLDDYGH